MDLSHVIDLTVDQAGAVIGTVAGILCAVIAVVRRSRGDDHGTR